MNGDNRSVKIGERLTWDYEGGRLEAARPLGEGAWECRLAGDEDDRGRNRSAIWFAFDVEGLGGQPIDVSLAGLENEWNLRPSMPWGPETRPVVAPGRGTIPAPERDWRRLTQDEVVWEPAPAGSAEQTLTGPHPGSAEQTGAGPHSSSAEQTGSSTRLRLRFQVPEHPSGAATIAYIEPYTHADHQRFVRRIVSCADPRVRHRVLGRSDEDREIDLLTIGHARTNHSHARTVWLGFRQHPWETYSSYAAEGLIDWLLSAADNPGDLTWQIVPMVNVDGCARGHTRHNARGKDPNREWNEPQPAPEVACIREAIQAQLGGTPALFIDVHNNNQQTVDYLALSNSFANLSADEAAERRERYGALVDRLAQALANGSHFSGTVRRGGPAPAAADAADATAASATAASATAASATAVATVRSRKPFPFPSLLLEMRTGPLPTRGGAYGSVADQRQLGAALAQSILTILP